MIKYLLTKLIMLMLVILFCMVLFSITSEIAAISIISGLIITFISFVFDCSRSNYIQTRDMILILMSVSMSDEDVEKGEDNEYKDS